MPYRNIKYQRINNIMVISIVGQGNGKMKLIDLSMELIELFDRIGGREKILVVILTGFGGPSSLLEREAPGNFSGWRNDTSKTLPPLAESMAKLDCPIIAAINGDAVGQALELALACDLRIAQEDSQFALPQIQADLIPWDGGTQRLPRLVGRGKAMEMILTGEIIDAQEARRIGLVNKIVPANELMTVAMELAREMASRGPVALRYAKEAVNRGMDMTLDQGLRMEGDLYFLLHTTGDRTEGIQAFRQKRNPRFQGR